MKKTVYIFLLLLINSLEFKAQTYAWAKGIGNTSSDETAWGTTTDADAGVYTIGKFRNTVDFDASANVVNITSNGGDDGYLIKYDSLGNYKWGFTIGGTGHDGARAVATDSDNNILVTGDYRNTVDFDPSGNVANLTAVQNSDIYVAKYDSAGNYIWAISLGGTDIERGYAVTTDTADNVYVTGYFEGTVDFDPSGNIANLASNGGDDVFVAKYNPTGNYLWAINMGGNQGDRGWAIDIDPAGDVVVTGEFSTSSADFDPSNSVKNLDSEGLDDIFLAKYSGADGSYIWAFGIGSTSFDLGRAVKADTAGNLFITGYFRNTADFDPSGNSANLTSLGDDDIFIAKYNAAGDYLWANAIGSTQFDAGTALHISQNGNALVTGYFDGLADFDPSSSTENLTPVGGSDIFMARYNSSGTYGWAVNVGGGGDDAAYSMAVHPAGALYICGKFELTADFNPSSNVANVTSNGGDDIYIAKYGTISCSSTFSNITLTSCDSLVSPSGNHTYTSSGIYNDTVSNNCGGDSIITINLTITPSPTLTIIVDSMVSCNGGNDGGLTAQATGGSSPYTYSWSNTTTVASAINLVAGTYSVTVTDNNGCSVVDSAVIQQPDILVTNIAIDSNITCNGGNNGGMSVTPTGGTTPYTYSWSNNASTATVNGLNAGTYTVTVTDLNGCTAVDSLVLIEPPLATGTITTSSCDSFVSPSGNYTWYSTGTYMDTLVGSANKGCDSILTIDLTINTVDVGVTNNSPVLTANATGATYQWVDCDNNYAPIANETAQSYTATANGNYAVIVTQNNCTDTSGCIAVTGVGVKEMQKSMIKVFPNPASQSLNIMVSNSVYSNLAYQLFNSNGALVLTGITKGKTSTVDVSNLPTGIYLLKVNGNTIRFIKE